LDEEKNIKHFSLNGQLLLSGFKPFSDRRGQDMQTNKTTAIGRKNKTNGQFNLNVSEGCRPHLVAIINKK